jgi:hypothetical protein
MIFIFFWLTFNTCICILRIQILLFIQFLFTIQMYNSWADKRGCKCGKYEGECDKF